MRWGPAAHCASPRGKNSTSVPGKKPKTKTKPALAQTGIATGDGFKSKHPCLRIVTGNEISEMPRDWRAGGSGPSLVSPLLWVAVPRGRWCPPRLANSRPSQAGPGNSSSRVTGFWREGGVWPETTRPTSPLGAWAALAGSLDR